MEFNGEPLTSGEWPLSRVTDLDGTPLPVRAWMTPNDRVWLEENWISD